MADEMIQVLTLYYKSTGLTDKNHPDLGVDC